MSFSSRYGDAEHPELLPRRSGGEALERHAHVVGRTWSGTHHEYGQRINNRRKQYGNRFRKYRAALVAGGKGILAADETPRTLTRRLDALKIESTPDSRRAYREMFFTTPGIAEFISGVIMQDETIRQKSSTGTALADLLAQQGIIPGIKVDNGAKPLAGSPGENITEGLDGLRERLKEYRDMGARFAKWRAVIAVSDTLAERGLRAGERARARSICRPLPGAGGGADRRTRSADGRIAHHRALRRGDGECPARGLQRAFRSEGVSRRHVAQAQHGHLGYQVRASRRPSAKSRQPQSAVSAGMCRPRSPASSSYPAARITSSPQSI